MKAMKIVFAGTPEIAAEALRRISQEHEVVLAVTMPDAVIGRKKVLTPSPVASAAAELGIPVMKTSRIGPTEDLQLSSCGAQLAVVVAYGALLPESTLALFPCLNIHYSMLPAFRGATPLQHSMIQNTGIGISIFRLDQGMDTGPLIAQKPMEFLAAETADQALQRFTSVGVELLLESLSSTLKETPQVGVASYAPKFSRLDAKLNLDESADQIERKVRAFNPEPTAWVTHTGQPLRIISVSQLTSQPEDKGFASGQVAKLETGQVVLKVGGGGWLELEEVQPAGKSKMSGSQWWNGLRGEARFE